MGTAILQAQSVSGLWREVGRCSADPTIIAKRLRELSIKYNQRVRAIDDSRYKRVLDLM